MKLPDLSKLRRWAELVAALREAWKRFRGAGVVVTLLLLSGCATTLADLCKRYPDMSVCVSLPDPPVCDETRKCNCLEGGKFKLCPSPTPSPTPAPTPEPTPSPTPEPTPSPTPSATPNPHATPASCPPITIVCGPRGANPYDCGPFGERCISFDSHTTKWTGAPRGLACDGTHPPDVEPCGGRVCEDPRGQSWRVIGGGRFKKHQGEGRDGHSWGAEFVLTGGRLVVECCLPPNPKDREGKDMVVGRACHVQSYPRQ